jgi:isoquinoline 1-oxidoreductase beta subunit
MAKVTVRWTLNGRAAGYDGDGEQPLLWHLRDERGLMGTRYGCGIGVCGACTVVADGRAALAVPGVVAIVPIRGNQFPTRDLYVRDGIAVVARSTWAALQGRCKLRVQWLQAGRDSKAAKGALVSSATLSSDFDRALDGKASRRAPDMIHGSVTALREGTAEAMQAAFGSAARTLEMRCDVPLQSHAPMEPVNAVAHWQPDRCEIWAGTHFQSRLLRNARDVTGLPADRLIIHTPLLGGSFGRRLEPDFAIEAILVSRAVRKPVKLMWTREDDLREGLFGPPSRHRVRAALGADGEILAFDHDFAALSVRQQIEAPGTNDAGLDHTVVFDAIEFPYATRTRHVSQRLVEHAVRVFWWRRGFTPNHTFVTPAGAGRAPPAPVSGWPRPSPTRTSRTWSKSKRAGRPGASYAWSPRSTAGA